MQENELVFKKKVAFFSKNDVSAYLSFDIYGRMAIGTSGEVFYILIWKFLINNVDITRKYLICSLRGWVDIFLNI